MHRTESVIWFLFGMFIGSCNDVWIKLLTHIPAVEISLFRFITSFISLTPFIISNSNVLKSKYKKAHFVKSIIFFFALTLWELGVKTTQLSTVTLIGFSIPFFLLLLSVTLLNEKTNIYQVLTTTINFLLVIGIIDFTTFSISSNFLILILSSLLFSISDVLNKKYSTLDNHITTAIYHNIFAFIVSLPFALYNFVTPSLKDIFYMFCLGIESNIYLYALLKAFSLSEASFLSPFKYSEFIFSVILGYIFFQEKPTTYCFIVIAVIIISNCLLLMHEKSRKIGNSIEN